MRDDESRREERGEIVRRGIQEMERVIAEWVPLIVLQARIASFTGRPLLLFALFLSIV